MEYEKKLVSVIIPTYKRSELLEKAIYSVLNQTYSNLELLVVNDNNKNDIYSIELYEKINNIADIRVRLVEQERHINGAAARNAGIREAKGEYIAFLDDDDFWEPKKIELQVELLSTLGEEWGAVTCLMRLYSNGKLVQACLPYRDGDILLDILERRTSMGTGALLIRRVALDKVGYFDEELIRHQDLQLFSFLASKYKVFLDKKYLHNRELKDRRNQPSPEKLVEIKNAYFMSIMPIMNSLNKFQRRRIYLLHDFETAYAFIKKKKYVEGIRRSLLLLLNPYAFYLANERIVRRMLETKLRYKWETKYEIEKE